MNLDDIDDIALIRYTLNNININELNHEERLKYLYLKDKLNRLERKDNIETNFENLID